MLRQNFLKEKLNSGKSVIGTWAIIPSEVTTDIIASTGVDFIIIDREHGAISNETATKMIMTCESRGVSPVIRTPGVIEADILHAMDIGTHCIQVPNVATPKAVQDIVKFSKYPPIGKRGFSPFTRAGDYSLKNKEILTDKANANTLVAINIEGEDGIANIDAILEVKELDIVFIGLFDLSKSLGIPGKVKDKKVLDYLKDLTSKIEASGKVAGTIATSLDDISLFKELGLRYIVYMVDCEMLKAPYEQVCSKFNEVTNG